MSSVASMSFSAIIFDCDGTLAETAPVHYECIQKVMADHGYDFPKKWFFERIGLSIKDLLQEFKSCTGAAPELQFFTQALPGLYLDRVSKIQEIKVITDVVRRYADKLPIAVASAGQKSLVHATLQSIGLFPFFETIVTIEDVKKGKPEPDLFLEAAQRLNTLPEACLVYEDSKEGMEAARRAGMQVIDVNSLYTASWHTMRLDE